MKRHLAKLSSKLKKKQKSPKLIVDTTDIFERRVFLAEETYNIHILEKHPDVKEHFNKYVAAIEDPDIIVESETEKSTEIHAKLNILPGPEFHANTIIQYPSGRVASMYPSRTKKRGKVKWAKKKK